MVQLAGGVSAVQLRAMVLEDDAVAVSPVGAEGAALQLALLPVVNAEPCAEADEAPSPSEASTM